MSTFQEVNDASLIQLIGKAQQRGVFVAPGVHQAVAEALVFASKAGCDPAKVRSALMGGFAASRILEVHGERMIARSFDPGFRIKLHQKDLGTALDAARSIGVALPNTATTQQLMNSCTAQGLAEADHSALIQTLERLSDHGLSAG